MSERETQRGDGEVAACHICSEEFATQEELIQHMEAAHQEDRLSSEDDAQPKEAGELGV
jgi:hypothetical protein